VSGEDQCEQGKCEVRERNVNRARLKWEQGEAEMGTGRGNVNRARENVNRVRQKCEKGAEEM